MQLNPMICGEWDGHAVWLQWTPAEDGLADYDVEVALKSPGADSWNGWMSVVPRQGRKSHWAVIPLWREGWFARARVRLANAEGQTENPWEPAMEVTFKRCTALFEFTTTKYDQHFKAGTVFHCQVDAAASAYELLEDIEIKSGESARTRMQAMGSSGYFQLDYTGHFEITPSLGVKIINVEPSQEDVEATGRDVTQVKAKAVADQITMAVMSPDRY